eukprot:1159751-Pelagomonas_calceolata.AAC.1
MAWIYPSNMHQQGRFCSKSKITGKMFLLQISSRCSSGTKIPSVDSTRIAGKNKIGCCDGCVLSTNKKSAMLVGCRPTKLPLSSLAQALGFETEDDAAAFAANEGAVVNFSDMVLETVRKEESKLQSKEQQQQQQQHRQAEKFAQGKKKGKKRKK